jgi:hypothetical protein
MTARRVYCAGSLGRPCPSHAWVYYSGKGRPVERCPLCWERNERERKRENGRNYMWKRRSLEAAAGVSR